MYEYYFTFRSMTQAQQASIELSKQGIGAAFMRSPKVISNMGCGYAVRVSPADSLRTAAALRTLGIRFERIVQLGLDGKAKEVYL